MNIKKKLSALRRADAATEQKITASYPPDWDMEAVFQKSYRKYKEMEAGKPITETVAPANTRIRMHKSWVAAACLLLAVGIAGAAGFMKLAMRKPDTVPMTSTTASVPIVTDYTTGIVAERSDTTADTSDNNLAAITQAPVTQTAAESISGTIINETDAVSSPSSAEPQTDTVTEVQKQEPARTTALTVSAVSQTVTAAALQTTSATTYPTATQPTVTTSAAILLPVQSASAVIITTTTAAAKPIVTTVPGVDRPGAAIPPGNAQPPDSGKDDPVTDYPEKPPEPPTDVSQEPQNEQPSSGSAEPVDPELAERFQIKDQGTSIAISLVHPVNRPSSRGKPVTDSSAFYIHDNPSPSNTTYAIECLADGTISRLSASTGGDMIVTTYSKSSNYFEEVVINGCPGCLVTGKTNYHLIWTDGTYFISMYAPVKNPLHLIEIAESLVIEPIT